MNHCRFGNFQPKIFSCSSKLTLTRTCVIVWGNTGVSSLHNDKIPWVESLVYVSHPFLYFIRVMSVSDIKEGIFTLHFDVHEIKLTSFSPVVRLQQFASSMRQLKLFILLIPCISKAYTIMYLLSRYLVENLVLGLTCILM